MRKFLIPAAILASTLAAAAPAAAQWAPPGNAYGYNGQGQGRQLSARLVQLRREIRQLDLRNVIGHREAIRLDAEARNIENRLRELRYSGFSGRDRALLQRQVVRLEQHVRFRASNGNRRSGYNESSYGNDGYNRNGTYNYGAERSHDRDRDGRDDRYEDDRGRDYDGRRDRDNDNDDD